MKRALRCVFLAAACGALLAPALAQAECAISCSPTSAELCTGTRACLCSVSPRWQTPAVSWELFEHAAGLDGIGFTSLESETRAAFDAWAAACSRLQLAYGGRFSVAPPSSAINATDGRNRVVWISSGWAWGSATLGVTHPVFEDLTNAIVDADIELNDDLQLWSTSGAAGTVDVRSIVAHEAGHFWGAIHTPETAAVMAPTYPGGLRRTPLADDLAQLCCLYPAGSVGNPGDSCAATSDCKAGLVCAGLGAGLDLVCARACTPGPTACSSGYSCEPAVSVPAGTANACFLTLGGPSDLCAFCDQGSACSSGMCVTSPPYGFCSMGCASSAQCGPGYQCRPLQSGSTACVPAAASGACPSPQCSATSPCPSGYHCDSSGMCHGGGPDESCLNQASFKCDYLNYVCIDEGSAALCRRYCASQVECPAGQTCQPLSGSIDQVCTAGNGAPDAGMPSDAGADAPACGECGVLSCAAGYTCVSTPISPLSFCHQDCTTHSDCPGSSACSWKSGTQRWCACPSEVVGREQPCASSQGRVCAQADVCVAAAGSTDYRCRQRCTTSAECPGGTCAPLGSGGGACLPLPPDAGLPAPDAASAGPDAAAAGPDAAAAGPDAAAAGPDAAIARPDAALPGVDAATAGPDAGSAKPDAAAVPDAAAPGGDAAAPGPDAASPAGLDAASNAADGSATAGDSGAPADAAITWDAAVLEDASASDAAVGLQDAAAASGEDAAGALQDAEAAGPDAEPGTAGTVSEPTGCGCSSAGPSPALALALLALLGVGRRRGRG